jgi:HK97 family phage portal protein
VSLLFGRGRRTEQRVISPMAAFGIGVDPNRGDNPLSLVPLFAAHRIIIDAVAATPLERFRVDSSGVKQQLTDGTLFTGLDGTAFSFVSQCVASLLYDGNAFGYVTGYDYTGWPSDVVWLNPTRVHVEGGLADLDNPTAVARYYLDRKPLDPTRIVHIPWIMPPGKNRGLSPLQNFKVTYETGNQASAMARDFYRNNGIPSAHIKNTEQEIDDPAVAQKIKERYKADVAGRDVVVTGADWTIIPLGLPPDQAQFVQTAKLTATQIASIYGVPPEDIGGDTGGQHLTYKNLEMSEMRFYGRVVRPWAARIEQHLSNLLPRGQYVRFDLDAQVRADLLTRMQAHQIALELGVETIDEAREAEERAPLTPEQIKQWKELYGSAPTLPQPSPPGGLTPAEDNPDPGGTTNGQ